MAQGKCRYLKHIFLNVSDSENISLPKVRGSGSVFGQRLPSVVNREDHADVFRDGVGGNAGSYLQLPVQRVAGPRAVVPDLGNVASWCDSSGGLLAFGQEGCNREADPAGASNPMSDTRRLPSL